MQSIQVLFCFGLSFSHNLGTTHTNHSLLSLRQWPPKLPPSPSPFPPSQPLSAATGIPSLFEPKVRFIPMLCFLFVFYAISSDPIFNAPVRCWCCFPILLLSFFVSFIIVCVINKVFVEMLLSPDIWSVFWLRLIL